jgi:hypothetical protein
MTTAPTPRDKILMMFPPAILVVAVYAYGFFYPLQSELSKTQKALPGLQEQSRSAIAQFPVKAAKAVQVKKDLDNVQARKRDIEKQWRDLTETSSAGPQRNEKIENLTGLFKRYDLNILEQAQSDSGREATMPSMLTGVVKRLAEAGEHQRPQMWRFRIQGRFHSLLRVLGELAAGETLVIPLGLTMKEAGLHSDIREWTLLVWI